jgi:translation initiation factor IF-3
MRLHVHISSSTQALYRVFVQPALSTRTRPTALIHKIHHQQQPNTFRPFSQTTTTLAARGPPKKRTQLWNEEIPARRVQVVDPDTDTLCAPERLRNVLASFDHKECRLVCVSPLPTEDLDEEWIPTCKIINKQVAYAAEREKKKLQKTRMAAEGTKTLELNWTIDTNDLAYRMKRMQEFLAQGKKVEIMLARKKRGRRATPEECQDLLIKIREAVDQVKGSKELKEFEGVMAGVGALLYEGPKPS